MHVAITADPYLPVPPVFYGGIERVIDFVVRGLVDRGHRVTLIAHRDSRTPARLIAYGHPPHVGWSRRLRELAEVGGALWRERSDIDVIHSFGRLAALLPVLPLRSVAKIQSYQRDAVPWRSVRRAARLAGNSLMFTGCSASVYRLRPDNPAGGEWYTVFNGVDLDLYVSRDRVDRDAPLVFLGRLESIKGVHNAIAIARQAGRPLVIAGNRVDEGPEGSYFDDRIAPAIDGERVTYVGPVDDQTKNQLLGRAAALLMPIEWEEPFGIVMAEALACGTPVIGFNRGSVPEVVRNGVNGFACRDVADAVDAVGRLDRIDRRAVRADCERRFGAGVIVEQYLALYNRLRERTRHDLARSAA
jgi:glycosyltransferase involved in cell wall biosynthesis